MASQKLQDAFNECGDKLIDVLEVSKLELQAMNAQLSKLDIVRIFAACANSKRIAASAQSMTNSDDYFKAAMGVCL